MPTLSIKEPTTLATSGEGGNMSSAEHDKLAALPTGDALTISLAAKTTNASAAITGGTIKDTVKTTTYLSGEAIDIGMNVGLRDVSGVSKLFKVNASAGSAPAVSIGIASATVGAAYLPCPVQNIDESPVIANTLWEGALPIVADVGKIVYVAKVAGHHTLDISTFFVGDSRQPVGRIASGDSGAIKMTLSFQAAAIETEIPILSGSAFAAGSVIGTSTDNGVAKAYPVLARAGSLNHAAGIAITSPGAADIPIHLATTGISQVIADNLWDTLPSISDIGATVYASRAVSGHMTIDISGFNPTDVVQPLGVLAIGGTGACRISIAIATPPMTKAQYDGLGALSGANSGDQNADGVAETASRVFVDPSAKASLETGTKATGKITCPALSSLVSGTYLTIPDGTHLVKFEPRAKARTSVTMKTKASMADNETLIIDDGTNPAQTLESRTTDSPTSATGSITCPALSAIPASGDYITIDDGVNEPMKFEPRAKAQTSVTMKALADLADNQTLSCADGAHTVVFECQKTTNAYATGSITFPAVSAFLDNETITLTDGVNTATILEFDASGEYTPTDGCIPVHIAGLDTGAAMAAAFKTAVNGVEGGLAITAGAITDATLALQNDAYGTYNTSISDTVASELLTHAGMSGGAIFVPHGSGYIVVDCKTVSTDEQAAQAFADAINVSQGTGDLDFTAGTALGSTFLLTGEVTGTKTITITGTARSTGSTISTGRGGETPVVGATEIDLTGTTTGAEHAAILKQLLVDAVDLDITPGTISTATIPLTNDLAGSVASQNTAITETGGTCYQLVGMTGGYEWVPTGGGSIVVDFRGISTNQAVGEAWADAINVLATADSLNMIAGTPSGLTFELAGKVTQIATVAITGTGLGSTSTISAGLGTTPVADAREIDLTGMPTAANGATKLAGIINGVTNGLTVTAIVDADTVSVDLQNDAATAVANIAIAQTGGTAYTVTGMTGGVDPISSIASQLAALAAVKDELLALLI
jgi:hypothetical protein